MCVTHLYGLLVGVKGLVEEGKGYSWEGGTPVGNGLGFQKDQDPWLKTQGWCTTENSMVVNTTNLKNIQKANQQWGRGQQWWHELVYYAKAV